VGCITATMNTPYMSTNQNNTATQLMECLDTFEPLYGGPGNVSDSTAGNVTTGPSLRIARHISLNEKGSNTLSILVVWLPPLYRQWSGSSRWFDALHTLPTSLGSGNLIDLARASDGDLDEIWPSALPQQPFYHPRCGMASQKAIKTASEHMTR
jgi:hypothetical protein